MATKATNSSRANSSVSQKDIEAGLEQVKNDIAALTDTLAQYGKGKINGIQSAASNKSEIALKSSEETLNELRAQVEQLSGKVETQIKEKPLQSIAIAAGIGALFALIAKR
jgi:ElaB/YqjD/DUF883 family membrane-anchored ribosome-binding protein